MKNEFLQQRRHVEHATNFRDAREIGSEIKSAHRDRAGHDDAMRGKSGNPDGPLCRNYPYSLAGPNSHYAAAGVDQLILGMKMFNDRVPVREVVSQGSDLVGQGGTGVHIFSWIRLSQIRHSLSQ